LLHEKQDGFMSIILFGGLFRMKKLIMRALFIVLALPICSAYSQTHLTWTLGGSTLGPTAEIDQTDFQIQVTGYKYSAEARVTLASNIPGLLFNVNVIGSASGVTTSDGTSVSGAITDSSISLAAGDYVFKGVPPVIVTSPVFSLSFNTTANSVTYTTDQLNYFYSGVGSASITITSTIGIEEVAARSKACKIKIVDNKISVDLGNDFNANKALVRVSDTLAKTLYSGSVQDIDVSNYSSGLYIVSIYKDGSLYCSSKFAK